MVLTALFFIFAAISDMFYVRFTHLPVGMERGETPER